MFSKKELDIYAKLVRLTSSPDWLGLEEFLDMQASLEFQNFLDSTDGDLLRFQIRARSWMGVARSVRQFIAEIEEGVKKK